MLREELQNRLSSSFTVSYPDFPSITVLPRSITIHQEMGKHDIVEIRYRTLTSGIYKGIKTGVPVKISWKNVKASGTFWGYTTTVSFPTKYQQYDEVKVMCVGASYPLKDGGYKIWNNKTASEIAIDIAKKTKLKPMVTSHPTRFTQQSLNGKSYWEKLNELAEQIGYGIQVSGTELHFHPIDKMIDQFMTTIPIMAFKDPLTSPSNSFNSPTLDAFEPKIGDYIEGGQYNRTTNTVSGVDPITGKLISEKTSPNKIGKSLRKDTKDPLFVSNKTTTVVNSAAMARSLSGAASHLGRLTIPATGSGQGDPRIAPWRTVEVRGVGSQGDGFWIIKKVQHYLHADGRYQVEFSCLADGVGQNKSSVFRPAGADAIPYKNIANDMVTNPQGRPKSTKLSAKSPLVSQGSAGYKVSPRRWKGN
jgi:phage protein D